MTTQKTLSIIKPDAVGSNNVGGVISKLEKGGLKIVAAKMMHLSKDQAESFYDIHKERPFFKDLVSFMTSGPVLVMALEGEDAVKKNRDIMGATNPKDAAEGTIRKEFAKTIDENAVHGSDSEENAEREIKFFFSNGDICPRTR
ncbi:MAG: nucleoside-diphosphate kinase [Chlamydiia bacterium]|nr:nucleoside-diphosphate kinase [Chlamydiia bacterium]